MSSAKAFIPHRTVLVVSKRSTSVTSPGLINLLHGTQSFPHFMMTSRHMSNADGPPEGLTVYVDITSVAQAM